MFKSIHEKCMIEKQEIHCSFEALEDSRRRVIDEENLCN